MPSRGLKLATLLASLGLFWNAGQASPQGEVDKDFRAEIDHAVDRGVAFLRRTQQRDGTWQQGGSNSVENAVGATAMCATALLECGVAIDDSAVQKAANYVRSKVRELNYTYAISGAIIFLDRVSKGGDSGTIQMLAQKLQGGQQPAGGWTYWCPNRGGVADNSNGQFALLALWIARRNGAKVDESLRRAEKYFRENQQNDGGWAYQFVMGPLGSTNPQMTCAGLMALAFGFGTRHKAETELTGTERGNDAPPPTSRQRNVPDLRLDPQVMKAKDYLVQWMSRPHTMDEHGIYTLWTLERMCMIYRYTQFNGIDWYNWGARIILRAQRNDGGWATDQISGRNCETSWALLFLKKSDLTGLDVGEATFEKGNFGRPRGAGGPKPPAPAPKPQPGREGKPGEAKALAEELRTTVVEERIVEILDILENTKGSEYTEFLANAIAQVRPAVRDQVRKALQKRLGRMSKGTLAKYLNIDNKELKLAALTLLPGKDGAKEVIPDIIPLLRDRDVQVSIEAHEALKKISGKNFPKDASAWQNWWDDGAK